VYEEEAFMIKCLPTAIVFMCLCISMLCGCAGSGTGEEENQLLVGAAAENISPTPQHIEEGVYLAGYGVALRMASGIDLLAQHLGYDTKEMGGQTRKATGIKDSIWARAIAISDEETTFVIVVLDVTGIGNVDLQKIREQAASDTGLAETNILVAATHTHSGPDFQGLWGGTPISYREYVRDKTVAAIKNAVETMQPAKIYTTSFALPDCNHNRRYSGDDPKNTTDPTMVVLHATDLDDQTIATLVNYTAHPTCLGDDNMLVSPDFPGGLVGKVQEQLGGVAIFMNGSPGDVSASGGGLDERGYGAKLGEIAVNSLDSQTEITSQKITFKHQDFVIPVRNMLFLLAFNPLMMGEITGESDMFSVNMLTEEPYYHFDLDPIEGFYTATRVHYISFGDEFAIMTVPGEALTSFGQELKQRSKATQIAFLGLTNDTFGYFVPEKEWRQSSEEPYSYFGEPIETLDTSAPQLRDAPILKFIDIGAGIPFLTMEYNESVSIGRDACPAIIKAYDDIFSSE
jgi:hypothetical protein